MTIKTRLFIATIKRRGDRAVHLGLPRIHAFMVIRLGKKILKLDSDAYFLK